MLCRCGRSGSARSERYVPRVPQAVIRQRRRFSRARVVRWTRRCPEIAGLVRDACARLCASRLWLFVDCLTGRRRFLGIWLLPEARTSAEEGQQADHKGGQPHLKDDAGHKAPGRAGYWCRRLALESMHGRENSVFISGRDDDSTAGAQTRTRPTGQPEQAGAEHASMLSPPPAKARPLSAILLPGPPPHGKGNLAGLPSAYQLGERVAEVGRGIVSVKRQVRPPRSLSRWAP